MRGSQTRYSRLSMGMTMNDVAVKSAVHHKDGLDGFLKKTEQQSKIENTKYSAAHAGIESPKKPA